MSAADAAGRRAADGHALYRAASVVAIERHAIDTLGTPGRVLMERAGAAAFQAALARWPRLRRVLVLAGAGNNGGDGYVVARLALESGREARVLSLADPGGLSGEAHEAWAAWEAAGGSTEPFSAQALGWADLVVDALFGTGLGRPVAGRWAEAIEALNTLTGRQSAPTGAAGPAVLAIDIPSGLAADTGAVLGVAVRAALTVSFIGWKQGLWTGAGPAYAGDRCLASLDLQPESYAAAVPDSHLVDAGEGAGVLGPRPRDAHKGHNGHVLVIGGEAGMAGAARMAAEAAARAGAGLVSVATRAAHAAALVAARPELMVRGVEDTVALRPLLARASVVAIGPGLGHGAWGRAMFGAALEGTAPLVVDADALGLLAGEPVERGHWVLTPHPGEAARLLGCTTTAVQADRFAAARRLARRHGGVCVLKGAGSLIDDGERCFVCAAGNPGMASGGMGDVLTGVVAALLAQGLAPALAARQAVHIHARAADEAAAEGGERGLLATDLLPGIRRGVNP